MTSPDGRGPALARPRRRLTGVYPGSFDPPTVAHLAIARAARDQCGLARLDLVLSRVTLGKETGQRSADERAAALAAVVGAGEGLEVLVRDAGLLADLAAGYDWLVLGADKWAQVRDPAWYDHSAASRDAALSRLPRLALVARPPWPLALEHAPAGSLVLDVAPWMAAVSSTAVRAGARHWRAPAPAPGGGDRGAGGDPVSDR